METILSHGCWCSQLDPSNLLMNKKQGGEAVDELDVLCKNWKAVRGCNDHVTGGSCNDERADGLSRENFEKLYYDIDYAVDANTNSTCKLSWQAANTCQSDACEIDYFYVSEIEKYLVENDDWRARHMFNCSPLGSSILNRPQSSAAVSS